MQLEDLSFWAELTEPERMQLRQVALMRPQLPSESQLDFLEGLARTLSSPRLLTLLARTPHWLAHWPLLRAVAENEVTPEALRRDLELVVSLFGLLREMDRAPANEKEERAEAVKGLYQALPPMLKPIAKGLAKQLAKPLGGSGTTQELPAIPAPDQQDWETLMTLPEAPEPTPRTREELVHEAGATSDPERLVELMGDPDHDVAEAAFQNPQLTEPLLCVALQRAGTPRLFEEVYREARWYFRDPVRHAFMESPACPVELSRKVALSAQLVRHLAQPPKDAALVPRVTALFAQLEESEFQYVTYWAKRHAPNLLRVIKVFYDRIHRRRTALGGAPPTAQDGQWASLEERVFMATQATQAEQLAQALRDPDVQVFRLALENPALTPRILVGVIPAMDRERGELLALHNTWGAEPMVRRGLLHNPNLSEYTALKLLEGLEGMLPLVELLKDPRLPHTEVKRKALETLRALYLAQDGEARARALRAWGGELMRHLPQEILQDEDTLRQIVSDRQLDPGILLRLARNKLTPRSVLEQIAGHPVLMAHPTIMAELLLNPKTPRESAFRVWGLLSDPEKQALLRNPHLPVAVRHLG